MRFLLHSVYQLLFLVLGITIPVLALWLNGPYVAVLTVLVIGSLMFWAYFTSSARAYGVTTTRWLFAHAALFLFIGSFIHIVLLMGFLATRVGT